MAEPGKTADFILPEIGVGADRLSTQRAVQSETLQAETPDAPHLLDPGLPGAPAQDFERALLAKVVGQDDAIRQVVGLYQRFTLKMNVPGRPIGCFLFLGPTGTGKTRLAEATAELSTGTLRSLIKIDCGEFQHGHEIAKLTGSPPGYLGHRETQPLLTQENLNRAHTDSLKLNFILFDEIEKAGDTLWNLLLGILDKATLTLGDNRRVDFSNTIIFLTSNIGATDHADDRFGFATKKPDAARTSARAIEAARRRFPPEFFNRLDRVIAFQALKEGDLRGILDLELEVLNRRFSNHTRFLLSLHESAKLFLLREGTDRRYGARHLKRVLERLLVDPVCNLLATRQIAPLDEILAKYSTELQRLLFYRNRQLVELPDITPSIPEPATEPVPSSSQIQSVTPPTQIAEWCCF